MSTSQILGIDVQFPFEPYPIQKQFMCQVIKSLNDKRNALLESPTGTGKTLSLLCSSLAWLNKNKPARSKAICLDDDEIVDKNNLNLKKNNFPNFDDFDIDDTVKNLAPKSVKIYYSSRTHSQLSQSIKELKKTNFENNFAVVLGGRDLLCLNQDVQSLETITAKNQACKSKLSNTSNPCKFAFDVEKKVNNASDFTKNHVLDIEDLLEFGKKHKVCPYFASKALQERSEVIFLPYNYLLDPNIRKAQKIELENDVIIFDEGHNIEKTCEESVSVDLRSDSLASCIKEMGTVYQFYNDSLETEYLLDKPTTEALRDISLDEISNLKLVFLKFESEIDLKVNSFVKKRVKEEVLSDDFIFTILKNINSEIISIKSVVKICEKILSFLTCILPIKGPAALLASGSIANFKDFVSIFILEDGEKDYEVFQSEFKKKFKTYLKIVDVEETKEKKTDKKQDKKKSSLSSWLNVKDDANNQDCEIKKWVLHCWCLSPSVGLKGLLDAKVRTIILTSGTLSPLASFEIEFDTKFPIKLENPHIIKPTQLKIFTVSNSYDNTLLSSKFDNKDNEKYYKALGDTIVDICLKVPDGVLLFFSSYSVMNNSIQRWKDNDRSWKIWSKLNRSKKVFEEPKNRNDFSSAIERYRENIDVNSGSIFFGVCRGKMSEGIDLGDKYSRAVILVGLPYPAIKDPKVVLKKQYLERNNNPALTSSLWYSLQMKRALNQAVGRAIRHKNDYGCVFLLDYRFKGATSDLTRWCRNYVRHCTTYRDMIVEVENFFKSNTQDPTLIKKEYIIESASCSKKLEKKDKKEIEIITDFSFSEYTGKVKRQKTSKKTVFKNNFEKKTVKLKNMDSIFDSFSPKAVDENVTKTKRKHIDIEYDE